MRNARKRIGKRITRMNFRGAGERITKGVSKHSTLIAFVVVTTGVIATIHFAAKEVPKAKTDVEDILANKDMPKKEKRAKVVKTVVKDCWRTAAIAVSTILLVTSTSAITASNTAVTVAGLTNAVNLAESKINGYEKAVNDIPDESIKETVKQSVRRSEELNRPTNDSHVYLWRDRTTGVKFRATCQQIVAAGFLIDATIEAHGRQTISDFYSCLNKVGVTLEDETIPSIAYSLGWSSPINVTMDCCLLDDEPGETEWYIEYREPTSDY